MSTFQGRGDVPPQLRNSTDHGMAHELRFSHPSFSLPYIRLVYRFEHGLNTTVEEGMCVERVAKRKIGRPTGTRVGRGIPRQNEAEKWLSYDRV